MSYLLHIMSTTAHILAIDRASPRDIAMELAARARARRLEANLTQDGMAARAGVSLGSLKRFERTGAASLEVVARLALALGLHDGFATLLAPRERRSLDELLAAAPRRVRGRGR